MSANRCGECRHFWPASERCYRYPPVPVMVEWTNERKGTTGREQEDVRPCVTRITVACGEFAPVELTP